MLDDAVLDLYDGALLRLSAVFGDAAAVDRHGAAGIEVARRLGSPPWEMHV